MERLGRGDGLPRHTRFPPPMLSMAGPQQPGRGGPRAPPAPCVCPSLLQVDPYLPYEYTCEGMLQRIHAYIQHQVGGPSAPAPGTRGDTPNPIRPEEGPLPTPLSEEALSPRALCPINSRSPPPVSIPLETPGGGAGGGGRPALLLLETRPGGRGGRKVTNLGPSPIPQHRSDKTYFDKEVA